MVAEEIRKLAEETKNSLDKFNNFTINIKDLSSKSYLNVMEGSKIIEKSSKYIETINKSIVSNGEAINSIRF
ncbi:hypothetical protein [Defluviitalea phaphyphila]|uniref:hypothetical protein n=1 Tax=Defluviitalea phaphyphila TaxID=1473580 RepID=UPI0011874BA7|nr:hypothetical protein [Defluviitalea phaphyphila]